MVRPKASASSLEIASLFAASVTTESDNKDDYVARQGCFSIFSLLSQLAPQASHTETFPAHHNQLTMNLRFSALSIKRSPGFVQKWYIKH
jgi:hypothetical protein